MVTYREFDRRVGDAAREIVRRAISEDALEIRPAMVRLGGDTETPFRLRLSLRREEQYLQRLATITTEVVDSFSSMRYAEIYLSRFSFPMRAIPGSAYIRFHLESWLNEAYILKERLCAFAPRLLREFRQELKPQVLKSQEDYARRQIERLFEPLTKMRGGHVHASRYEDAELAQLALWEEVARLHPDQFSRHLRRCALAVRRSNLTFVKAINDGMQDKLDRFFNHYAKLAFTPTGSIRYPKNIRPS